MSTSAMVLIGAAVMLLVVGLPVFALIMGMMFFKPKNKKGAKAAHEMDRDEIMANVAEAFSQKWEARRTADLGAKFKDIMGE